MTDPSDRAEQFEAHRDRLLGLAYRMLGTWSDAKDIVQEASVRWLQADKGEDVRSAEAYLTRVVTNLCVDHLRSARSRREEYVGEWLPEPIETGAEGDPGHWAELADSLSMAFLRLLETLTPVQRAVFLLHEVFGLGYEEISETVGKTEAHCRKIAQRARTRIAEGRPRFDASKEERDRLLRGFLKAIQDGDVDALQEVLAEDVVLHTDGGGKARATMRPIYGADRVTRFFVSVFRKAPADLRLRKTEINGEPGFILYADDEPQSACLFHVEGALIQTIYGIRNPDKLHSLNP